MTVKMSGEEFKRFWSDKKAWPGNDGDTYVEDEVISVGDIEHVDGVETADIKDTDIVKINGGYIYSTADTSLDGKSLETHFKQWKKNQSRATLLVECDKALEESIKAAIIAAGGKII